MKSLKDLHSWCYGIHPCTCIILSDFVHNLKDNTNVFNSSLCSVMSYLGYVHIKQILISQERSNIWKSCKELV